MHSPHPSAQSLRSDEERWRTDLSNFNVPILLRVPYSLEIISEDMKHNKAREIAWNTSLFHSDHYFSTIQNQNEKKPNRN